MFAYSKSSRTHVELPRLSEEDFVTAYAQQRPFREGGNRLEKDFSEGKVIMHNYGHGGAGVSLAPGSAIEAVRLAEPHLQKKGVKVAVIGSGVVGLFNCKELLKHHPELKITVYAERVPVFGEKDNEKLTTSQVAPGFWLPYHYGSNNSALHARLSTLSLDEYSKLAEQKRFSTVLKSVQMIDVTDEEYSQDYFKVLTEELRPSYHQHQITLNQKIKVKCRSFATIKIDMQPFIRIIIDELKSKGVRFVTKKVNKQKLYQLEEEIIFNCSGLGSRELFGDSLMRGIKGHLVEFKNSAPQKYDFLMRANVGKQMVTYYMHQSRIILGLTREDVYDCKVDPAKVQHLIDSHQKVLEKFGLTSHLPKL